MIAGNRLLQRLGPVLKWAAQEDLIPTNFVPDIRKAPEQKRTRKLTDAEIRKIWNACGDDLGSRDAAKNFGRMVRFLLVTAQRRDEAASLRHGHILDGVWRQTDNKCSRPHSLKLPPLALSLVGQGGARDFVFAGSVGKISGFSKLKIALDEASGVTDWRLHDLRRTAASKMQGLGVPNHVVQAVLNHAIPGVGGVLSARRTGSSRRPRRWRHGPRRWPRSSGPLRSDGHEERSTRKSCASCWNGSARSC